jgi:hypothetical protein
MLKQDFPKRIKVVGDKDREGCKEILLKLLKIKVE